MTATDSHATGPGEADQTLARRLATELPDIPRWIDTRGMLLTGHATVIGGDRRDSGYVVRVVHGAMSVVAVVGCPSPTAIARAIDGTTEMTPVVAQVDNAAHVESALAEVTAARGTPWTRERAIVHRLTRTPDPLVPRRGPPSGGPIDPGTVRLLTRHDPLDHLPAGLRFEMTHALDLAPVAGVFDGARPVAFCYPCWTTETLWDVSIDTLDGYRRRGLAEQAARFMIDHMRRLPREPVWSAVESNGSSLRLAARLGFAPVDEMVVFARGRWAYLTAGFEG